MGGRGIASSISPRYQRKKLRRGRKEEAKVESVLGGKVGSLFQKGGRRLKKKEGIGKDV